MLCDEVEPLGTDRAVRPVAQPAAGRRSVLATPHEGLSSDAKSIVTKSASCDEPSAPFSEADLVTACLFFTKLDIQGTERTKVKPGIETISEFISN